MAFAPTTFSLLPLTSLASISDMASSFVQPSPPAPLDDSEIFAPIPPPQPLQHEEASKGAVPPSQANFQGKFKAFMASLNEEAHKEYYETMQKVYELLKKGQSTPLPQEYLDYEKRMDQFKKLHEDLIKMAALQVHPGRMTTLKLATYTKLNHLGDSMGSKRDLFGERFMKASSPPPSPLHHVAVEVQKNALAMGGGARGEEGLGGALYRWAEAEEGVAVAHQQLFTELNEKFVHRINRNLQNEIHNVNNYRRKVHAVRLHLDGLKARARSASPEKAEQFTDRLRTLQNELNFLIGHTQELMRKALASDEPSLALNDYVESSLEFYRKGFLAFNELAPQVRALKGAQDTPLPLQQEEKEEGENREL